MSRKLFVAIDKNGNKHHIDKIDDPTIEFFCPFCKKPVIPKFGDKKVNHFAHKELSCGLTKQDNTKETSLDKYKTISKEKYFEKKPESEYFTCPICKSVLKKEFGTKLDEKRYICKDCIHRVNELI